MATKYELNDIVQEYGDTSFLKIGGDSPQVQITDEAFATSKYEKVEQIWGTLGWANDRPMTAKGSIEFSKHGNIEHAGPTAGISEQLIDQNPEIKDHSRVIERFIDLSKIEFTDIPQKIENVEDIQLRFDLFIEKHEGALVYLEENPMGQYNSDEAEIYLVTPDSTDPTFSQDRFKLTYKFNYSLNKKFVQNGNALALVDLETNEKTQFSLKILTFPRTESNLKSYAEKAIKNINRVEDLATGLAHSALHHIGAKKYALYKFKSTETGDQFVQLDDNREIDETKKTLLLIHGTFSTVNGSFEELTMNVADGTENRSLLKKLIDSNTYEQIIGFNHPTASHSVAQNVDALLELFGNKVFSKPVDIITTSRGALIAEVLVSNSKAYRVMRVNKIMTFAPAHGSHLLIAAKGLDTLLSMLRKTATKAGWGYVLAIAQFSIGAIRTQPGLEVMMPDSKELKDILSQNPISEVKIKAMVGDYHSSLIERNFVRWGANGLDKLLWLLFRSDNDWVIGCPEQRKQMSGFNAKYEKNFEYYCIHGKQFDPSHPKKNGERADVRKVIFDYFSEV